jgi:hypothetical protein
VAILVVASADASTVLRVFNWMSGNGLRASDTMWPSTRFAHLLNVNSSFENGRNEKHADQCRSRCYAIHSDPSISSAKWSYSAPAGKGPKSRIRVYGYGRGRSTRFSRWARSNLPVGGWNRSKGYRERFSIAAIPSRSGRRGLNYSALVADPNDSLDAGLGSCACAWLGGSSLHRLLSN